MRTLTLGPQSVNSDANFETLPNHIDLLNYLNIIIKIFLIDLARCQVTECKLAMLY